MLTWIGSSKLPEVDDPEVVALAEQALRDSPIVAVLLEDLEAEMGARASRVKISFPKEIDYDKRLKKRLARAQLSTVLGNEIVYYTVEWHDKDKGCDLGGVRGGAVAVGRLRGIGRGGAGLLSFCCGLLALAASARLLVSLLPSAGAPAALAATLPLWGLGALLLAKGLPGSRTLWKGLSGRLPRLLAGAGREFRSLGEAAKGVGDVFLFFALLDLASDLLSGLLDSDWS